MNKKFFVIDGHALVYRSYFAFIKNPRMTSCGLNTSAIYGFTNTIFRILNIQKKSLLGDIKILLIIKQHAPNNLKLSLFLFLI